MIPYPVPSNPPDEAGFVNPQFNENWVAILEGFLANLRDPVYWESPPSDIIQQIDELRNRLWDVNPIVQGIQGTTLFILGSMRNVDVGAAIAPFPSASHIFNMAWAQSAPAINNQTSIVFYAQAGNYSFNMTRQKASNQGILTAYIDGVLFLTNDGYAAANTFNVATKTAFTVVGDGLHRLTLTIASKNASSSNYFFSLNFFEVQKL